MITKFFGFFLLLLICSTAFSQPIKNDEKIRLAFGVASITDKNINNIPIQVEKATFQKGLKLPISEFKEHIIFLAEYEQNISDRFSYMIGFEYHDELITGSSSNNDLQISQGMNFQMTYFVAGLSLIYYLPVFKLEHGNSKVFFGSGFEIFYTSADLYYFYDQRPLTLQVGEFLRSGYNAGGKIFVGLEIPFIQSVFLQLRTGYAFRDAKNLNGKVKFPHDDLIIDPNIFIKNNSFDLSGIWVTFGFSFYI